MQISNSVSKPTIAIIYHFFPHYRAPVIKALSESRRYNFVFWGDVRPLEGIKPFTGDEEVKIHKLEMHVKGNRTSISGWQNALLFENPKAVIILGDPNIIQTWVIALVAKSRGIKVFFWTHGWLKKEAWLKARVRQLYLGLADGVLVYSDRAKDLGVNEGFKSEKIFPIYNSLDWDRASDIFSKISPREVESVKYDLGIEINRRTIICTARLTALCRFDMLLSAMKILADEGLKTALILVGDGPIRSDLEKQAAEDDVDVRFCGAIYDEDVLSRLIFAADVTVSPGKVGLTAMHSLMYGTPVISHDNLDLQMPEVEVVKSGVNGYLFAHGDVESLANAIRAVLAWPKSRNEIREDCRRSLEGRYTPNDQRRLIEEAARKSGV